MRCRSWAWRCSRTSRSTPCRPDYATDKILPYFVSLTFPAGIVGLVIASIMAASLSSVDSAINSCTSVVIVDFYHRLVLGRTSASGDAVDQRRQVQISRIGTLVFGAAGTFLAMNVSRIGSLLEIANKLINAFAGPLFGIYLLAMFSRRTTATPALAAGIVGTVTSYVVAYHTSIGFMWPSTFGLAATLLVELGADVRLGRLRQPKGSEAHLVGGDDRTDDRAVRVGLTASDTTLRLLLCGFYSTASRARSRRPAPRARD